MTNIYRVGRSGVPAAAAGDPCWLLRNLSVPDTTTDNEFMRYVRVREISVTLQTAVETSIGLIYALTPGTVVAGNFQGLQNEKPTKSQLNTQTTAFRAEWAWGVNPTIPVLAADQVWLGKVTLPASIGASVSWTFDKGEELYLPGANSTVGDPDQALLLWNWGTGAAAVLGVTVRAEAR